MTMPFLYQLQGADHASLSDTDFRVAVVDPDDSALTSAQVDDLQAEQGKLLYAYTSIGEAESYRDYWQDSWSVRPPDYVLGENEQWDGNFRVKFWDPQWQEIVLDRVDDAVASGYDGIYLDIVDGYTVDEVIEAYPGTRNDLRGDMIDFVIRISEHAKAKNPDFDIIPQNAVGLLGVSESGPDRGPNTAYLNAIDGLGVEDLWFDDDDVSDWTQGDLDYIALAQAAGKFVLATSYPTDQARQEAFVTDAVATGLIPFVGNRELDDTIDPVNGRIGAALEAEGVDLPWTTDAEPEHRAVLTGTDGADELYGGKGPDEIYGGKGSDVLVGYGGDDVLDGGSGSDEVFGGPGQDRLKGNRGSDYLEGGPGGDVLSGQDGRDDLVGGAGDDDLQGGQARDDLFGGGGRDVLDGGSGRDYLEGGPHGDSLFGGPGRDELIGGGGRDTLSGSDGADDLKGDRGNDRLEGGNGRDRLAGGPGDDVLEGGRGRDELFGGAGRDQFVFSENAGRDVIGDFDPATDVLLIDGLTLVDSFEAKGALILEFDGNTRIELVELGTDDLPDVEIVFM